MIFSVIGFVVLAVVVVSIWRAGSIQRRAVRAMDRRQLAFHKLGVLQGKAQQQIIAKVGPPNSIDSMGPNRQLLQWTNATAEGSLHIALSFENGVCVDVPHQSFR